MRTRRRRRTRRIVRRRTRRSRMRRRRRRRRWEEGASPGPEPRREYLGVVPAVGRVARG